MHNNMNSILAPMHRTTYHTTPRRSLFALPPSLLRHIIQRSQPIQTVVISPTIPAAAIPRPKETLGE